MNTRKILLLLSVLLAFGCSSRGPTGPNDAGSSVLIYGRGNDSKTLDPADAEDGESVKIISNVFDNLVHYADTSAELVPVLATEWTTSEDGKTWTFQLREGVSFHDGTPFDSSAVAFTFERLIDLDSPHRAGAAVPYHADYKIIDRVEATSPMEVVFHLKRPSGVFLRLLAMFPAAIVSPAAVQKHGEQFKVNPVGTGPFRFEEWVPEEKLLLAANEQCWRGRPKLDAIIFKPILEPAARLRQLSTGEIHMADELSVPVRKNIRQDANLVLQTSSGLNTAYLSMNNDHKPFDDVRVRRAIAHAIDKEAIARSAYEDEGIIATTLVPKSMWGHHDGLKNWPHDPARAKELLAEAGVAPGTKIKLFAPRNSRPYMPSPDLVLGIVLQSLREVGFEPVVMSPDWAQYLDQVSQGEHDIALFGWITDTADPDNFLYTLLDKDNAHLPKAHNVSFYRSEAVHELLLQAQGETDQAKRLPLYLKAQEIIHEDCPMVPLMHLDLAMGLRKNVKGYFLHPTGLVMLRAVSLDPADQPSG